jgi:hypothetical protein
MIYRLSCMRSIRSDSIRFDRSIGSEDLYYPACDRSDPILSIGKR